MARLQQTDGLTDDQTELLKLVRVFVEEQILPVATELEHADEYPTAIVEQMKEMGIFGLMIPEEYGGLGESLLTYALCVEEIARGWMSVSGIINTHFILAYMLIQHGTEEQKQKYLPRMATGELRGSFSMSEPGCGSDVSAIRTKAVRDGDDYVINGEKLWCTNGTRAELFVVMARTADREVKGKHVKQITAFIVDSSMPGVEVKHRLRFMGLKAIENGVIRFNNVKVPRENILWGEGKGLKLALVTLNTGRLTLPAGCTGAAKAMLRIARKWAAVRVQWGQPIGKHEAVAQMLAKMASNTFALEAVAELATALYEKGGYDIRLEAAIAKLYNSEAAWKIIDDTLQIRGGRGYETAESLRRRGEEGIAVERAMRDFRINLIFEGSSEIMRLFIAREAVDHHFKLAFDIVKPESTMKERLAAMARSTPFYLSWYPSRWVGTGQLKRYGEFGKLATHMRFIERNTRHLGRSIFHAMVRYGPKLERKQAVLFRAVDIGAELFAMSAACVRAQMLAKKGQKEAITLADTFCREARLRITNHFDNLFGPNDENLYKLAMSVLKGEHAWLEHGITSYDTEFGIEHTKTSEDDEPLSPVDRAVLASV